MRKKLIQILLKALNSSWLNATPCEFAFVGNVDAFSRSFLASSEKQQPGITVKQVLEDADRFKACPIGKTGLTVMEADGTHHEATVWDRHELNQSLSEKPR